MVITIKGADYSAVSIGKIKSYLYYVTTANQDEFFVNPIKNNDWGEADASRNDSCDFWYGTEVQAANMKQLTNNSFRIVSDYIPAYEGMEVHTNVYDNVFGGMPFICCYNSNKEIMKTSCIWKHSEDEQIQTVPAGVSFITIQMPGFWADSVVTVI